MTVTARLLTHGVVEGKVAWLSAPLSLWGGLDIASGTIVDVTHPQHGMSIAGKVLVMPAARGSSSSSSALLETVRLGVAPTAIILEAIDPILVIGALVAAELYGVNVAILLVPPGTTREWELCRTIKGSAVESVAARASIELTLD